MPTKKQHNKMIAVDFELKRRNPKSRKVKNPIVAPYDDLMNIKELSEQLVKDLDGIFIGAIACSTLGKLKTELSKIK